jgi:putative polymerase
VHAVVLVVLLLEAINPSTYSALFHVQDYYINTRGYVAENFWNKESDLFVSAVRPDTRMFSFIELHRLSSVFLEPVSLGNYCIVITAFVCACFRQLTTATRWFLIVGTLLALLGCDGRLAALSSLMIIAAALAVSWLPPYSAVLYLPGVTAAVFVVVYAFGLHGGSDDFSGRIAHTVELIERFGLVEFLGVSTDRVLISQAVDSGLAYLILTQSLFGVVLLWLFIALGSAERTPAQLRFKHAACIYLSLTMMVSFAFLSIKTAALLWFVHGALQKLQTGVGLRRLAARR